MESIIFLKYQQLEHRKFWFCFGEKTRSEILKICLINSWKTWIWNQYLSEIQKLFSSFPRRFPILWGACKSWTTFADSQMHPEYLMGCALCRRPLTIAHCSKIADSWHFCKLILAFLVPKLVIWHARCLHFGVAGDPGTILGHWGAQERTLWGPGLDSIDF